MQNYRKYRWFYTKSGKLVYGGKSAEQNEDIVNSLKGNYMVMHTKIPGSPFAIVKAAVKKINKSDLEEVAIWTACFSRAWKLSLKKAQVDIFTSGQIFKKNGMKTGTFGVAGSIDRKNVELKLVLTHQKGILRAVPESTLKNSKSHLKKLMVIIPGNISKEEFAKQAVERLKIKNKEEILNALPTGEFREMK